MPYMLYLTIRYTMPVLARKAAMQRYAPSQEVLLLMRDFKAMTNICIEIGLRNNAHNP